MNRTAKAVVCTGQSRQWCVQAASGGRLLPGKAVLERRRSSSGAEWVWGGGGGGHVRGMEGRWGRWRRRVARVLTGSRGKEEEEEEAVLPTIVVTSPEEQEQLRQEQGKQQGPRPKTADSDVLAKAHQVC